MFVLCDNSSWYWFVIIYLGSFVSVGENKNIVELSNILEWYCNYVYLDGNLIFIILDFLYNKLFFFSGIVGRKV